MNTAELGRRLSAAEAHLADAMRSLIRFDSAADCPRSLQAASDILQGLPIIHIPAPERPAVLQRLQNLAQRADRVERMLDSAASLHFGSFLNSGLVRGGYNPEGALDNFGGGGFQIEG